MLSGLIWLVVRPWLQTTINSRPQPLLKSKALPRDYTDSGGTIYLLFQRRAVRIQQILLGILLWNFIKFEKVQNVVTYYLKLNQKPLQLSNHHSFPRLREFEKYSSVTVTTVSQLLGASGILVPTPIWQMFWDWLECGRGRIPMRERGKL